jgi:protein-S-isoprenylcysteine O-methyltransferase Ste14
MKEVYNFSIILIYSFAVIVFILLFYISAPYGKFLRKGWGFSVSTKWAWMIMEFPSPALMFFFFITADRKDLPQVIFISLWLLHYIHRAFIYPFTQSGREKPYPLVLVIMALLFNCFNGFVNGYGVFHIYFYDSSWLFSWQFVTGIIFFITGFIINKTADEKFRVLRSSNPKEYLLPEGWLFRYISCPHYFGEIIEWAGWAVMTWSLPGLAFFSFTFANLFPRGVSSHKWYRKKFPEYPLDRKAVIPFLI